MGVHGLWKLIESAGKPVPVETLDNKVLAVDVSIWLHQLMKGYQNPSGSTVANAYLLGLFSRVCKLLFTNIKPVFVFDGGVPQLKKKTIAARQQQKDKSVQASEKLREQLLKNLLKQKAVSQVLEEIRGQSSPKKKAPDMFELPPLPEPEDSASDVEEISNYSSEEDVKPLKLKYKDLHTIDVKSEEFKMMPADMRHDILTELKETRKQNSWGRIHEMPEESGDFSKYQMSRLLKRRSVQVSLEEAEKEMGGRTLSLGDVEALLAEGGIEINPQLSKRIASDDVTRFIYVRETGEMKSSQYDSAAPSTKLQNEESSTPLEAPSFKIKIKEEIIYDCDEMSDAELVREVEAIERVHPAIKVENEEFGTEDMFENESNSEGVIMDDMDLVEDNSGLSQEQILAIIKQQNIDKAKNLNSFDENLPSTSKHIKLQENTENKLLHKFMESDEGSSSDCNTKPHYNTEKLPDLSNTSEDSDAKLLESLYLKLNDKIQLILSKKAKSKKPNDPIICNTNQNVIHNINPFKNTRQCFKSVESTSVASHSSDSETENNHSLPCQVSEIVTPNCKNTLALKNLSDSSLGIDEPSNDSSNDGISDAASDIVLGGKELSNITPNAASYAVLGGKKLSNSTPNAASYAVLGGKKLSNSTPNAASYAFLGGKELSDHKPSNGIPNTSSDAGLGGNEQPKHNSINIISEAADLSSESDNDFIEVPPEELITIANVQGLEIQIKQTQDKIEDDMFADIFLDKKNNTSNPITEEFTISNNEETVVNVKGDTKVEIETSNDNNSKISEHLFTRVKEEISDEVSDNVNELVVENMKPVNNKTGTVETNEIQLTSEENPCSSSNLDIQQDGDDSEDIDDPSSQPSTSAASIAQEKAKRQLNTKQLEKLQDILENKEREILLDQNREDRMATSMTDQMYLEAQELLRLFGVPYLVAPMEAEAQCAFMDSVGLTQGTITDDSDIWLFGGRKVYKNFFDQKKFVLEFQASDIQHYFKLSRGHLVLLALLVGSDYTVGLQGVGPVTALEILATFPPSGADSRDADQLLASLHSFKQWWQNHSQAHLTLAKKLRNIELHQGFPSAAVASAYLQPVVDDSREPFSWGTPNLAALRDYAESKFGWNRDRTDQILMPVVNRLSQKTSQLTLHTFFGGVRNITAHREQMSRRVQLAVNRLDGGSDHIESVQSRPRQSRGRARGRAGGGGSIGESSRGRGRARGGGCVGELSGSGRGRGRNPLDNDDENDGKALEVIPQREKDRLEALKRKQQAIEIMKSKKSKRMKKRRNIRQEKPDANLSESSSDDN